MHSGNGAFIDGFNVFFIDYLAASWRSLMRNTSSVTLIISNARRLTNQSMLLLAAATWESHP